MRACSRTRRLARTRSSAKAVGEPPLMPPSLVWTALKDAIASVADHSADVDLDAGDAGAHPDGGASGAPHVARRWLETCCEFSAMKPSASAFDQGFEQSLEFARRRLAVAAGDVLLWLCTSGSNRRARALPRSELKISTCAGPGDRSAVDQRVGRHAVDDLGERRVVEQHGIGQLAHRLAVAVGQHLEDAPAFDRRPRRSGALRLPVDLAVGLGEQIGQMAGDGRAGGGVGQGWVSMSPRAAYMTGKY